MADAENSGAGASASAAGQQSQENAVDDPNLRYLRTPKARFREGLNHLMTVVPEMPPRDTFCRLRGVERMPGVHEETEEVDDLFNLPLSVSSACFMCNGYYAQNHGEATCSICHAFLFPHYFEEPERKSLKKDPDSDSGNDEPQDSQLLLKMYPTKYVREHRRPVNNAEPAPMAIYDDYQNLACNATNYTRANLASLPTEVLMIIVKYLDELSRWSLSQANKRLSVLISRIIPPEKWKQYTLQKWQFLSRRHTVRNWYKLYSKMMFSSFCFRCTKAMSDHELFRRDANPWRDNRLRTEARTLQLDPLQGIWAVPLDRNMYHWQGCIEGPPGSAYEGGKFYLYLQVPNSYPMTPPLVRFITRIFHPNISRHGDIGIDSIQHNWSLALTIAKILISIQSMLTEPYCEIPMEREIADLYTTDPEAYDAQASLWTWKYAMNELRY